MAKPLDPLSNQIHLSPPRLPGLIPVACFDSAPRGATAPQGPCQGEERRISKLTPSSNQGIVLKRSETSQSAQRRYLAQQTDYNYFGRKSTEPQVFKSPSNAVMNSLQVVSPSQYNFNDHKRSHPSMLYPQMHLCGSRSDILIQNHVVDKVLHKKYNVFLKSDKQDRLNEIQAF